jgi:hypothetical protein
MNNRAVVLIGANAAGSRRSDDWLVTLEAQQLFQSAQKGDSFFIAAKANYAGLLNYYRIFAPARPLWEQVAAKGASASALEGQAIAAQGVGNLAQAAQLFGKAIDGGLSKSSFSARYHEAARASTGYGETGNDAKLKGAEKCVDLASDISTDDLTAFEKSAVENLKKACTEWKGSK